MSLIYAHRLTRPSWSGSWVACGLYGTSISCTCPSLNTHRHHYTHSNTHISTLTHRRPMGIHGLTRRALWSTVWPWLCNGIPGNALLCASSVCACHIGHIWQLSAQQVDCRSSGTTTHTIHTHSTPSLFHELLPLASSISMHHTHTGMPSSLTPLSP